jgi:hypothetical protein
VELRRHRQPRRACAHDDGAVHPHRTRRLHIMCSAAAPSRGCRLAVARGNQWIERDQEEEEEGGGEEG